MISVGWPAPDRTKRPADPRSWPRGWPVIESRELEIRRLADDRGTVSEVAKEQTTVEVAGREVTITNPSKIYFAEAGYTKLDLVRYYVAVADGALRGVQDRPSVLKRFVEGAGGEAFFQKRAPRSRPDWIEVVELTFPSGRTADEVVLRNAAQLIWTINLGCIDLNPHPVRADDLDHPDELRVDLDPVPGIEWSQIRDVAFVVRDVLGDLELRGWPKTSGSRGIHVNVRLERKWGFDQVRRAALAIAREVERRAPALVTSRWWKEERHGVFLDYNQNAKDRTVASAYSVRPTPDARVSLPLTWEELARSDPADYTLATVPARFQAEGDPSADMNAHPGSLTKALELAGDQEAQGLDDAPWPPHFRKQAKEAPRVEPSRRKKARQAEEPSGPESPPSPPTPTQAAPQEADEPAPAPPARGRRPRWPLRVVAKAKRKEDALEGLERWRARYPEAAQHLEPADVLVDAMRGRSSIWTRVRINLRHVPEKLHPPEEPPDPDYDPRVEWAGEDRDS